MSIKKLVIGLAVVALAFTVTVASADTAADLQAAINAANAALQAYQSGSSAVTTAPVAPLTLGSTGAQVSALQTFLVSKGLLTMPAGVPMGYFGSLTQAAVKAYQVSKGITPTAGYYGSITAASVAADLLGTGGTCPAGQFDPATGKPCGTTGGTLPAGCTSTVGYSPTTGAKCDDSSSGPLTGDAGDLTVAEKTGGTVSEVQEGEDGVKVLGIEVEADGSDIAIKNMKVSLVAGSDGSTHIDRYIDSVDIMLDGKVVGSADVEDFSKNGTTYTETITVDNAVVKDNEKEKLYVAFNTASNIDTADLDNTMVVTLVSTRFEDATGVVTTDTTASIAATVTFADLATGGSVTLTVSEGDSLDNETISVDATTDTNEVDLLNFSLKAKGSDITINSIPFALISAATVGVTEIINDARLLMDGEEVGDVTYQLDGTCAGTADGFASSTDAAGAICVDNLDDDDVVIADGETVTFTLQADVNDIDGAFTTGDKFTSITLADDTITAEDEDGNTLTTGRKGTADTTLMEFLSTGIKVTTVSAVTNPVATFDADLATDDKETFEITFDVEAIEDDAFIEAGVTAVATQGDYSDPDTGANYYIYGEQAGGTFAATTTGAITLARLTRVSGGSISGDFVKVGAGTTARFKLAVTFDPGHLTATSEAYAMVLASVNYATTAANETATQALTPVSDYSTESIAIGN